MSLVRLFFETVFALAHAGQWDLLSRYLDAVMKVLTAPEAVIIPGLPIDKEIK